MNNILGYRLKKIREKNNLSQKRAANIFGITNFQLSRYENGQTNPDPDLITKFAEYYEVTTDYLLGRTENPKGIIREDGTETDVYELFLSNDRPLTLDGKTLTPEQRRKIYQMIKTIYGEDESR